MTADKGDRCELCHQALADGQDVVQIVRDRHPTYDKEVVLSTFHPECWDGMESVTRRCSHCGCRFRLILVRKGEEYQNLARKLFCPFCGTMFESQMGF